MNAAEAKAWRSAAITLCLTGLCSTAALGCSGLVADALGPDPKYTPEGQTQCRVKASQDRPLIIEWPASDRADLELLLSRGLVVVQYSGCEMRLLRGCSASGAYRYRATTRELAQDTIRSADELYAKLPLGAVSLEGAVERGAELTVSMTVVGKYLADRPGVSAHELSGAGCAQATHVITGLTAGAFEFFSSKQGSVKAELEVVGSKAEAGRVLLRKAGDQDACRSSSDGDTRPPENCGALLRVEVSRLECALGESYREGRGCVPLAAASRAGSNKAAWAPLLSELGEAVIGLGIREPSASKWRCAQQEDSTIASDPPVVSLPSFSKRPRLLASALLVVLRGAKGEGEGVSALSLEAFVLGDPQGTVRMVSQHAGSDSAPPASGLAAGEGAVAEAPGKLGELGRDFVARLTAPACGLELPTARDVALLPLDPAARRSVDAVVPSLAARSVEACRAARAVKGPWLIRPERAGVLAEVEGRTLTLEAGLHREGERLCLTAVRAEWLPRSR